MYSETQILISLISVYVLAIIVPLVPAVLTFKLFPETKVGIGGPLGELTVRATGAFAAYVVTFIICYTFTGKILETVAGFHKPVWTVTAKVIALDQDGQQIEAQEVLKGLEVTLNPRIHQITTNLIKLRIPATERDWPMVSFEIPKFGAVVVNLNEAKTLGNVDDYHKTIELLDPVIIQQYAGSTVPYQPETIPTGASQ